MMIPEDWIYNDISLENYKGKASGPSWFEVPFQIHWNDFSKLAEVLCDVFLVCFSRKASNKQFQI